MENKMKTILGDDLLIKKNAFILKLNGKRNVLSTSLLNGGTRDNIKAVFNFDGKEESTKHYIIKKSTYQEHLRNIAINLGLNPNYTTGLSTCADIKNFGISIKHKNDTAVLAIVTAGVGGNACRAGDPASFDEMYLEEPLQDHATINIILEINANLSMGALTNALITVTEAKSALLQELQIGSLYSNQIATGTGTDGCIVISNHDSNYILTNSGKHSLLGELIANAVKEALRQALFKQEKITAQNRFAFFILSKRYGINEKEILRELMKSSKFKNLSKKNIQKMIKINSTSEKLIISLVLFIHLSDLINWRIIKVQNIISIIKLLTYDMFDDLKLDKVPELSINQNYDHSKQILGLIKEILIVSLEKMLV
ncbi:MAG: adenosylcobinamide amidohydrolase [Candidatus Odinarchaeota archaeon]